LRIASKNKRDHNLKKEIIARKHAKNRGSITSAVFRFSSTRGKKNVGSAASDKDLCFPKTEFYPKTEKCFRKALDKSEKMR
jgi:hypothetical protein